MGTNAIISVLGFIIVFSIVATTLNKRNTEAYQNTYGYADYTIARDIARNSIQVALRTIDTTSVLPSTFTVPSSPPGSLEGGTFRVDGVALGDSLWLTANSTFNDSSYRIKTKMVVAHTIFPQWVFQAALGVYSTPDSFKFKSTGFTMDGRDHDVLGNLLPLSADSVSPIHVRTAADSASAYNASYPKLVDSIKGTPKITVDSLIPDPAVLGALYYGLADSILINNAPKKPTQIGSKGTQANPIIVFCDGTGAGAVPGNFVLNSGDIGWGILVVKGSLTLNGNSEWHGLIIEYGNWVLDLNTSVGNSKIIGGVLFGGLAGSSWEMGGGSMIQFSKAALTKAKNIKTAPVYKIVDWYE